MLKLTCPHCGIEADETELSAGGDANLRRAGPDSDDAAFEAYMFLRENPMGPHLELWRHAYGCGKWFIAARDTLTLEVYGTYRPSARGVPKRVREAIARRAPAGGGPKPEGRP